MRGFLKGLVALALIIGLYYLHRYSDMHLIEKDSLLFVNNVANTTISKWEVEEFRKSADPNFPAYKNAESNFAYYKKLGRLTQAVQCEIQDISSYHYPNTSVLYVGASYQCQAAFEKGPATLFITLYRITDKLTWKITSFDLYSQALPAPTPPAKPTASGSTTWH